MKSKEINALFAFVSFLHENAWEFSNFNGHATNVANLVNSPLSFAAEGHNDKMKAKAAMRLRIQEYSTPIIENVEGPIKEKLAELEILGHGIGLDLADIANAVNELKRSAKNDISKVEKCKNEYLEVCAIITPLREYFFPLFHSIDRILIDELFAHFLPEESVTDFNKYRRSIVEAYLPTEEQQGTDSYSTPVPEEKQPEEVRGCDYNKLAKALARYIQNEPDTPQKLKCFVENGYLPNPATDTRMRWIGKDKVDAGAFWKALGWKRKHWMAAFSQPWDRSIQNGNVQHVTKNNPVRRILRDFDLVKK